MRGERSLVSSSYSSYIPTRYVGLKAGSSYYSYGYYILNYNYYSQTFITYGKYMTAYNKDYNYNDELKLPTSKARYVNYLAGYITYGYGYYSI